LRRNRKIFKKSYQVFLFPVRAEVEEVSYEVSLFVAVPLGIPNR
jgi:hypothetical protein